MDSRRLIFADQPASPSSFEPPIAPLLEDILQAETKPGTGFHPSSPGRGEERIRLEYAYSDIYFLDKMGYGTGDSADRSSSLQLLNQSANSPSISMANAGNFWQRSARTDLKLMRCLLDGSLEENSSAIGEEFKRIMRKASSARQICITRSFLEFLKEVLEKLEMDSSPLDTVLNQGIGCL